MGSGLKPALDMNRIHQIEEYAKSVMIGSIAHDFMHVDRVRQWAIKIAQQERYPDLDQVEAAALLHDIGLSRRDRKRHAEIGAELATALLQDKQLFTKDEIAEIAHAIRFHSSLHGEEKLLQMLRDADTLDLLGAVGVMRACTSKHDRPEYPPELVKGETWGWTASQFTERFRQFHGDVSSGK